MAAVKAKKPASKKLKASQKKKTNKWLIVGGISAVAIIGVAVVRFSSASQWVSIWRSTNSPHVLTDRVTVSTTGYTPYKNGVTITKGSRYRFCLRGYNTYNPSAGRTTAANIQLSFDLRDLNRKSIGTRAPSTKTYSSKAWSPGTAELHCSAEFSATKASYIAIGQAKMVSGSGQFIPTALSIDYLR